RRDHNYNNPTAVGRLLLCCIGHFCSLDSLWGKFKRPCHYQCDRESDRDPGNEYLHHPGRRFEGRKQDRSYLHQQPRHYRVSNRNFVNVTPLQLGKEGALVVAWGHNTPLFDMTPAPSEGWIASSRFRLRIKVAAAK